MGCGGGVVGCCFCVCMVVVFGGVIGVIMVGLWSGCIFGLVVCYWSML